MEPSLTSGMQLSLMAAGQRPSAVEPLRLINSSSKEQAIIAISTISLALASFLVVGRAYLSPANNGRKLGWDDGMQSDTPLWPSNTASDRFGSILRHELHPFNCLHCI